LIVSIVAGFEILARASVLLIRFLYVNFCSFCGDAKFQYDFLVGLNPLLQNGYEKRNLTKIVNLLVDALAKALARRR